MNQQKKKKMLFLCIAVVLVAICGSLFIHLWSKTEIGCRFIFESDYNQMEKVANHLISLDQNPSITIVNPFGLMLIGPGKTEWIKDPEINITVFLLFVKGYDRIEKNDGKTICFERWYDGFERYRGYAFSIDGTEELSIEFMIEQKAMPETDWYYYIEDYNEWRVIHQSRDYPNKQEPVL